MSSKVWLITGASSGLGLEFALYARAKGHHVIGTVRSKAKSAAAVAKLEAAGASVVLFDASAGPDAIATAAKTAEAVHGRIDVLVNNAGYSLLGAVEDFSPDEARRQMETNYFGPLFLIQALLPGMRNRASGIIVNVSSVAGIDGLPSCGLYASSKFALEGLSESLAKELTPLGLQVLIVNPGAFRTGFLTAYEKSARQLTPAYVGGPVDETFQAFERMNGKQPGDAVKGAKIVVDVIDNDCAVDGQQVSRLPIGADSMKRFDGKIGSLMHDRDTCRVVAESAAY